MVERGFQFATIGSDARLMAAGAQQVVGGRRAGLAGLQAGRRAPEQPSGDNEQ